MPLVPHPLPRPKFAHWRYDRNLTLRRTAALIVEKAEELGRTITCSYELVRTLCLPFGDPGRTPPSDELLIVITALTEGAVTADHFVSPLRAAA